jgi:biopolymer transport protein ExbB
MFIMFLVSNYYIILKFLQLKRKPNTSIEEAMNFIREFKGGLWWLDFSATTGPLIGLLGTIVALIEAFQQLSTKGIAGVDQISAAIGFALIATAIGILLSLWNYFFFKLFNHNLSEYKDKIKAKLMQEVLSE